MPEKPPDLTIRPLPGQDVVTVAPTGEKFAKAGWRNSTHTRHRLPGSTVTVVTPPPDPEPEPEPEPEPSGQGEILISRADLMTRPTSGPAWDAMLAASRALGPIALSNQEDHNDVRLLAAALVAVRTGASTSIVAGRLAAVPNTENGGETLALGRNLLSVVLAADLIGYREPAFVSWLTGVRTETLSGRTLISTHDDRPNNWGTHAGASRIAADLYLGDTADLDKAIKTFRGWLGDRAQYAGFKYTAPLAWHANESQPLGVNPQGATKSGNSIDGVLPDDQRRAGGYTWPPPKENYVYEALQGAVMQAELLYRAGHPAYGWSNSAILRAFTWLHSVCKFPSTGDDTWQAHLVNHRYGSSFPAPTPSQHGKNMGFTDWLYGG